jgi:hypothetical protein
MMAEGGGRDADGPLDLPDRGAVLVALNDPAEDAQAHGVSQGLEPLRVAFQQVDHEHPLDRF